MSKNQASSSLLSSQENIALAELIERKTQSLASAVVQVFLALPANSHTWTKECSGVACFIKDNPRRSYYIRVYSLKKGAVVWEQELYNQIEYRAPHSHLHTFAADDCEAGLNFADEQEARKFHLIVQEKIRQRQSRQEKRHHGPPLPSQPPERKRPSISHQTPNVERSGPEAQNSGSLIIPTMPIQNPDITSFRYRGLPAAAPIDKKKKKEKGKGKKKMTKADIGAPSNFLHVGHVGWDPNKGFDVNEMDPDLKNLFHKAGISEDQMTDAETSKVLYDFIEHQGGLEAMKEQMRKQDLAPTPPTRSSHPPPVPPPPSSATPPPRGRQGPLPPLPPPSSSGISPPPPPPPSSGQPRSHLPPPPPRGGGGGQRGPPPVPRPPENPAPPAPWGAPAPPPPPPPPPPPSLAPPPGGGLGGNRPELTPAPSSGRGALLDQIRTGRALKKVTNIPEVSQPPEPESDGLVGALMMVMKQRSKVIHSSDEGEDEGVDDDFDDEWDD